MVSFLFMFSQVKKISCVDMLTLLDEIFIVVIGVGTFIGKKNKSIMSTEFSSQKKKQEYYEKGAKFRVQIESDMV